ncbi:T9SS type A sorting domain-containing protein [Hymenobacter elongatus]|uniref:T9SS type A sorting domain-containing protein n=1 Tax=Hymenobacter elongatus TaxID=877208 RepID=UPI001436924E|nr:T9SS type A sorting domain-containing protein [Hymenobacter elongatus]
MKVGARAFRDTKGYRQQGASVRPAREMRYYWNPMTSTWEYPLLFSYTYDDAGRTTQTLSGDSTQGPLGTDRDQLTFDSRGNLTGQLVQIRDTVTAPWINLVRVLWTYDARDRATVVVSQTWVNDAWRTDGGYRATNSYSSAGVLIEEVLEEWAQGAYRLARRNLYALNATNQWSSIIGQRYSNGGWVNDTRIADLVWFDWATELPTSYAEQEWSGTAWETNSLTRAVWQPNGSYQSWDQYFINGQWQDFNHFTVTFDDYGTVLEDTWEQRNNGVWGIERSEQTAVTYTPDGTAALRSELKRYNSMLKAMEKSERHYFFNFVPLATRAKSVTSAAADLYPNPTHATATLVVAVPSAVAAPVPVQVLNNLGQVVQQYQVLPYQGRISVTIDVSALAAGVYVIRLLTPQGPVNKRLVRE